ncbi:hypothetical protein Q9R08_05040 [Microbacterium sp. QXD-8]|uniref:Uncharacterized protein n=1 Tax=Microbacterium psychrotolerans TaxID=3068321 RepID=A0ABU0YZZ6_9MICO|nr:hypothetical protein [Microbacterium sp. QXD-8]MDQ7877338.1 hypothetical protein [Microbacterium sp. QXD-8]
MPDTIAVGKAGECVSCTQAPHAIGVRLANDPTVPVRTYLRPWTYRQFEQRAKATGRTVAEVLSALADAAVPPRPDRPAQVGGEKPMRRSKALPGTDDRIRDLNAAAFTDGEIAQRIGMSLSWTRTRRGALGLESPKAKNGRRRSSAT